ncbi:MAG: ABC transporter substrate-binding protein, partial [Pseudomonadota bacterium]
GPVADQAGINVLTFSTTPSVAGKNVFVLGQTAATEADRLLSYASSQGIGSLGLFYPRTPSGQVAAQALRQAAAKHGLTVLTTIDYPRSFQGIQDRSQVYAAEHSAQAVAIPEGGQGLVSAGAFLNYYNVSPRSTRYLGLGQWNGPATSTEAALQGGWFVAPDPALFDAFAQRYLATYGTNPAPIAGLAYDGIAAVGALIRDARAAQDSQPFAVDNLVNPSGFAGVNGIFRLRRDGMIDRALAVMEVTEDGFTVRDPAPRRFDRPSG